MTNQSILKKYRRQPKLQVDLPSRGEYYPPNALYENQNTDIPVFSMTPNDEIAFKTPDALINGEATVATIKSCIPTIVDPWSIPTIDIDTVLVAIRIASYGGSMTVNRVCGDCGTENQYEIPLSSYLDSYLTKTFVNQLPIDNFIFHLRPLNYREFTNNQKRLLGIRRSLNTIIINKDMDDEQKGKAMDPLYMELARAQLDSIYASIVGIEVEGELEQNKQEIADFLENNDNKFIAAVKQQIEENFKTWSAPMHKVSCTNCEKEDEMQVTLDTSDFFGKG